MENVECWDATPFLVAVFFLRFFPAFPSFSEQERHDYKPDYRVGLPESEEIVAS